MSADPREEAERLADRMIDRGRDARVQILADALLSLRARARRETLQEAEARIARLEEALDKHRNALAGCAEALGRTPVIKVAGINLSCPGCGARGPSPCREGCWVYACEMARYVANDLLLRAALAAEDEAEKIIGRRA